MFYGGYKPYREKSPQELKSDLEYAQRERERLEAEIQAYQEQTERRREQRQEENRESYEYSLRQANDWPEALTKQIALFGREADDEVKDEDPEMYFTKNVLACQRALEIWQEEETLIDDQVAELQRQISALRDGLRAKVASRLEAENPDYASVAGAIEAIPEIEVSSWLNW